MGSEMCIRDSRDTMRDLQEKIAREQAEKPAPAVELEGRDPDGR